MCSPKTPVVKNIVPTAPSQPEAAPEPVKIDKDGQDKAKRKRNPLRIDLASGGSGVSSGVTV